jgi:hypothetical protein
VVAAGIWGVNMGRGLFDLIAAYNGGQGQGYAPFNPGFQSAEIGPQQAIAMQARGNLMSQPGAGPSLIGNVAGGFLGGGIRAGINKYKASRPEAKLQAAMSQELDVALNERMAKMMKANPSLDARHARVAAAEELFAWTARSKQSPQLVDMARQKAMMAMQEMGEFDPEAQEKYSVARKNNAEVDNQGKKMVTVMDKSTRALQSLPEAVAAQAIEANPNLMVIDNPPLSSLNADNTFLSGEEEVTTRFDPNTGQFPVIGKGPASMGKGKSNINLTQNGPDHRTESQLGEFEGDFTNSFAGMASINHAIDELKTMSENAEKKGIEGVTGSVGGAYRFLGETAQVVSSAANIAKTVTQQNGGDSKVYADGTMTYDQLTDEKKYDSIFKNLKLGGQESKRIRAGLINLAYMLAITEESSARAISDNDIKLRLTTLGADISSPNGFRQVLEDRRRNAMFNLKARLDADKVYSTDQHYRGLYDKMAKQYNMADEAPVSTQPRRPTGGAPETTINPDGTITVRNKK